MRVRVQQEQKFLVTTERALWRYDNSFIFTNQSEVQFGITLVITIVSRQVDDPNGTALVLHVKQDTNLTAIWKDFEANSRDLI